MTGIRRHTKMLPVCDPDNSRNNVTVYRVHKSTVALTEELYR